jgi:3-deoxy-D-manno-octulosonic-acid transferase
MYILYSVSIFFLRIAYGFLGIFDLKIRRSIEGRKKLFAEIEKYYPAINPLRKRVLIHVSSFGELEQAKPIIATLKETYPDMHIHLTFFSPSGYDNAINSYTVPDIITYLPFDSIPDINWFLDITKPELVLFVRYDLWHNLVHEIHDRNIPMLLFSATFDISLRKSLPFIKSLYGKTYSFINSIYTISDSDKSAIETVAIHAKNIIVAGDTRCDQVITRQQFIEGQKENILPDTLIEKISSENLHVFIAGSTWENDEKIIAPAIRQMLARKEKLFSIIAPHEITEAQLSHLTLLFGTDAMRLSEISRYKDEKVIIVDSIGKLFSLYRYGSFAYIGGGFSAGVHNILEPAVWGVPSIVGPNHKRSKEIGTLMGIGAAVEIRNQEQFADAFQQWFANDMSRRIASVAAKDYVYSSQGATRKVIEGIKIML